MSEEKRDRRIERTRRSLHQALMDLILEKRYDKITVQDIIDRANVGRSTFYAHFLDKEDLLVQGFALFSEELSIHIETSEHRGEESGHILHSLIFFQHAEVHHDMYKALLDGGGVDVLLDAGRRHLTSDIQNHLNILMADGKSVPLPMPVVTSYLAGAMLSVLTWWLDAGRPFPPREINAMFQQLAMEGLEKLLESS